jgi:hypothetical protein
MVHPLHARLHHGIAGVGHYRTHFVHHRTHVLLHGTCIRDWAVARSFGRRGGLGVSHGRQCLQNRKQARSDQRVSLHGIDL